MKKNFLKIAIILFFVIGFNSSLKAQDPVVVHGIYASKFYLFNNHQLYKILGDEYWFSQGTSEENTPSGRLMVNNYSLLEVSDYDPGDDPIDVYWSCYEAKLTQHGGKKGECGPLRVTMVLRADGTTFVDMDCYNLNNNACLIISNSGTPLYSPDGNY
jgi:hypothetical protein